ncbi:hypothetical protein SCHPADRAFT_524610 [Schizopora paradoxa]|uniref:Uncharacterized protein n=1 Tax=Schizopora paradoxa TaxID=27342 RepID=A0A0H2RZY9_9AGAM|nr:hypothetical protein SCHPADRAFT_524610 [Schizopora paradoxa]
MEMSRRTGQQITGRGDGDEPRTGQIGVHVSEPPSRMTKTKVTTHISLLPRATRFEMTTLVERSSSNICRAGETMGHIGWPRNYLGEPRECAMVLRLKQSEGKLVVWLAVSNSAKSPEGVQVVSWVDLSRAFLRATTFLRYQESGLGWRAPRSLRNRVLNFFRPSFIHQTP